MSTETQVFIHNLAIDILQWLAVIVAVAIISIAVLFYVMLKQHDRNNRPDDKE